MLQKVQGLLIFQIEQTAGIKTRQWLLVPDRQRKRQILYYGLHISGDE
jgi:hypothetical protein